MAKASDLRVVRSQAARNAGVGEQVQALLQRVEEAFVPSDSPEEIEGFLARLTPGQRALLAVNQFEMEVNSGGFDTYFRYSAGSLVAEALEGLARFGAGSF